MNRIAASLFFLVCAAAQAQTTLPEATDASPDVPAEAPAPPPEAKPGPQPGQAQVNTTGQINYKVDPDTYSILSSARGVTTHKATFVYPATYSDEFKGNESEMVFQISGKWRVFGSSFFLAYSQKSFWQWINSEKSSPFRETNYNPEVFYRWRVPWSMLKYWGADFGVEHESNGQTFPLSRSWNRAYVAPFQARGHHLAYLKFWYRLPEGSRSSLTNQGGDDNPDITDYMGYAEWTYSHQLGYDQLLTGMFRLNPVTGRGATQITWSIPSKQGWVFWAASVFHGYGESLALYDQEVTRFMVGAMLAR